MYLLCIPHCCHHPCLSPRYFEAVPPPSQRLRRLPRKLMQAISTHTPIHRSNSWRVICCLFFSTNLSLVSFSMSVSCAGGIMCRNAWRGDMTTMMMTTTTRPAIYLTSEEEILGGFGGWGGEQTTDDTTMMMARNYYYYYYYYYCIIHNNQIGREDNYNGQ